MAMRWQPARIIMMMACFRHGGKPSNPTGWHFWHGMHAMRTGARRTNGAAYLLVSRSHAATLGACIC